MLCTPAFAQAPPVSQVTPQTLRPTDDVGRGGVLLPESAPLSVPVGAEALSVTIAAVDFEGEFRELTATVRALTTAVAGKRLTVAQLYTYAYAVEQAYAAEGYVLVRVVVPPQELVDGGTFKLVIVDGYIEDIDVSRLSVHVRDVVADRTASMSVSAASSWLTSSAECFWPARCQDCACAAL